jgi:hypothetical protein
MVLSKEPHAQKTPWQPNLLVGKLFEHPAQSHLLQRLHHAVPHLTTMPASKLMSIPQRYNAQDLSLNIEFSVRIKEKSVCPRTTGLVDIYQNDEIGAPQIDVHLWLA